jgi:hypothetical protein
MRIKQVIMGMAVMLILAACQKEEVPETDMLHTTPGLTEQAELLMAGPLPDEAIGPRQGVRNFRAQLTGAQEVPPVETLARGQSVFQLSRNGELLSFRVIVANLDNVTMGHIHLAPAGQNGPVVVWLYPDAPPPLLIPGTTNGVLATGVITAENLVGPLADATMADLLEYLEAEGAYVNIHTEQYPAGEIRGQIK